MERCERLGPWIRRFLLEYLILDRNLSVNTQRSYRDTLALLLPYLGKHAKKTLDNLEILDLSADHLRGFLNHLEQQRNVGVSTRNHRLAVVRSLARFVAERSPEHVAWYGQLRTIPIKQAHRDIISYLEKDEIEALLAVPNRDTYVGARNYALLLFLYNSGARVSEAAHLCIADLNLPLRGGDTASVRIMGKGGKARSCPLWKHTATEITNLISRREPQDHVFLSARGAPLTRFGIYRMLKLYAAAASKQVPSLRNKRISPHTLRHSTATHLLRAGVDINTIRAWLGHVSLETTQIYAEIDLEMKARALEKCDAGTDRSPTVDSGISLMDFLRNI